MARPTKEDRLSKIHEAALIEFNTIQAALRDERMQCLKDRRFYSIPGAQWEGPLGQQFENKPKFEVNKIHLSVIRIINEYRNNRITVNFESKDGAENDKLADTCDGLYRANEDDSTAEEAYDNAFEEAVGGGFGAWRLRADYEDDEDAEDERQHILIEPIYDADSSVFFDLQAKRQDKADAKSCFVLTSMTPDAYEDEYNEKPTNWDKTIYQSQFDWSTPDVVFVAEYYKIEEVRDIVHIYEKLDGTEERVLDSDLDEDETTRLEAIGAKEVRKKPIKKNKVHKYILSGAKVLEDCGYIAGTCIPIVPVYGKRWFVDNVERCMGHVRLATDVQRLKNMQLSKLGEISAYSTIEKPIFTPEQVANHQLRWEEDNIKNYPYLLINPIADPNGNEAISGPIGYTRVPTIPPAMAALLTITEEDMKDLLGNQQAGEEITGNVSTETAHLIQNRLDMQTFIYMSNMAKSVKRSGEIWLSMAKDVYVEEGRKMKTIGAQGEVGHVELMKPMLGENDEATLENDLGRAKFKVSVEVGPSSSTKRSAIVGALTRMIPLTDDPETKQVLGAMTMMNMEGEGISDVRDYFRRKLIKMGVVKPNEQEAAELAKEAQGQQPSPQDQYFEAAAHNEQAKAVKAQAEIINTQADADKTRAETVKIMADVDESQGRLAMDAIEKLGPHVAPPSIPGGPVQQ